MGLLTISSTGSRVLPLLVVAMVLSVAAGGVQVEAATRSFGIVPADVSILRVTATGSGCPATTPSITISADKQALTIPFSSFEVAVPAASPLDKEKSCLISINLKYPAGWSYVGSAWTYQGWVELNKRLVAHQSAKYYYIGGAPLCYKDHVFNGGRFGFSGRPYTYTEACADLSWSPCGQVRGLNVLTRISIDNRGNPRGSGVIKSEVIDGQFGGFVLRLRWRHC